MHVREGSIESLAFWYDNRIVPANDTVWNATGVPLITLPLEPSVVLAAYPASEGPDDGSFLGQATAPIHNIRGGFGDMADDLERYVTEDTRCLVIISGALAVRGSIAELEASTSSLELDPREVWKDTITKRLYDIGITDEQLDLRDLGPQERLTHLGLYYAGSVRYGVERVAAEKASEEVLIAAA